MYLWLFCCFGLIVFYASSTTAQDLKHRPNTHAAPKKKSGPFRYFKTEPDFEAVKVKIKKTPSDPSRLAPGYYLLAPFREDPYDSWGPQIVDQDGQVVWYGQKSVNFVPNSDTEYRRAQDFKICDYLGGKGNHLCSSESHVEQAINKIFDSSYNLVEKPYVEFNHWGPPNPHEFNMLPGGRTFIQALYRRRTRDLTAYKGRKEAVVFDPCFQEINVKTRKVEFGWCFLDHYGLDEGQLYLNIPANAGDKGNKTSHVAGDGGYFSPWDIAHMNSVDKNAEGDYIISCRHMDSLFKIAGNKNRQGKKPGQTIWRLGGKNQDFQSAGNALFSRQHCARFVNVTETEETVLLFNNAWEGINEATARTSSALMLTINNATMQTTLRQMYIHPDEYLSPTRGGVQMLPNGNIMVGWGALPEYSEYTQGGELLYHASFSDGPLISYRVVKQEWEGNPQYPPKIIAYSQTCEMTEEEEESPLVAYVSWNGATKLAAWRFSVTFDADAQLGIWYDAGTYIKTGFETTVFLSTHAIVSTGTFVRFVSAEALDSQGNVLSQISTATWVPKRKQANKCNAVECFKPMYFTYGQEDNGASRCKVVMHEHSHSHSEMPAWLFLILFIAVVEGANFFSHFMGDVYSTATSNIVRGRGRSVGIDDLPSAMIKES